MHAVLQAELRTDAIEMVTANDASRRSFTVAAGGQLLAVAGDDLSILHAWPLAAEALARAAHASLPDQRLALVSGADRVVLLDGRGTPRWALPHAPWTGDFESGCTWFDASGRRSWVGLSVGEGQDAARAWWVRVAGDESGPPARLDVVDAGWDDAVLIDVDGTSARAGWRRRPIRGSPWTARTCAAGP